jgi:hypothetical protein
MGDTHPAANTTHEAVQAAIDAASDGDLVTIPSGSSTWDALVTCDKGIMIQGAGAGSTVIAVGAQPFAVTTKAGYTTRITEIGWDGSGTSAYGVMDITGIFGAGNFRVDHCLFDDLSDRGFIARMIYGLVDNNVFHAHADASIQGLALWGDDNVGIDSWLREFTPGTVNAIYVEDNQFLFDYPNDGALDAYAGARYVFRHNIVTNTMIGHHGADSGGYRSVNTWEIYENTFSKYTGGNIRLLHSRGGSGVIFNNKYYGNYLGMDLSNYRSCGSYSPWGQCQWGNSYDGNEDPPHNGYPCLDQNGIGSGAPGTQTHNPIYAWGNTLDGAPVGLTVTGDCADELVHIVEDRDFFNGTERPGYSPYIYPHPLRGGGEGASMKPTALRPTVMIF